jgi:hypothetical protein
MPLFSMTDLTRDTDFAQTFVAARQLGIFAVGTFQITSVLNIPFLGIIQPISAEGLQMLREGDRIEGAIEFFTEFELFQTYTEGIGTPSGTSDQVLWRGDLYAVRDVTPWKDFGFFKCVAVRLPGV